MRFRTLQPTPRQEIPQPSAGPRPMAAPVPAAVVRPLPVPFAYDDAAPFRKLAVFLTLVLLLFRFSMLPEILAFVLNLPSVMYLVVYPLAIISTVMSGGMGRLGQTRLYWPWVAFFVWMVLITPFSSWVGGSIQQLSNFMKGALLMVLIISATLTRWKEFRTGMVLMATGFVVTAFVGQFFNSDRGGRMSLSFGTIGNSNDLAAHLLLTLPAMLFIVMSSQSWKVPRILGVIFVGVGLYVILASGSRGALVAMFVMTVFFLLFAPTRARLMVVPLAVLALVALLLFVKESTFSRLASLFSSEQTAESMEAQESSDRRKQMLRNGLVFVRDHPLNGVGPGQFSNFNGKYGNAIGERTYWTNAHNSYLTAAAEAGIPGFLCYVAAFWVTFRTFWRVYRITRGRREPVFRDIALASFCLLLGFLGFSVAIFFLNFTYLFHAATITGLAVCLARATQREIELTDPTGGRPTTPVLNWMAPGAVPRPAR